MRDQYASGISSRFRRRLLVLGGVAALLTLVFWVSVGASLPDDGVPIEVSGPAAAGFVEKIAAAAGGASGGSATITVSDEEVTSFLVIASRLSDQAAEAGGSGDLEELFGSELAVEDDPEASPLRRLIESQGGLGRILSDGIELRLTVHDPEVRFRNDGAVVVRGTGRLVLLSVPARIVVIPGVVDGRVEFEFLEGQLGRLPLPSGIINLVADGVEKALLAGHTLASVDAIDVTNGRLTLTGTIDR